MKPSPNQILIAASNILSGCVIDESNVDACIKHAIDIATKLAEAIQNTEDIFDKPSKIKEIIINAYDKLGNINEVPTSLLQETIRVNEGVNRMVAVAYMQKAMSLEFIVPINKKGSKTVKYILNKTVCQNFATP